MNDKQFINWSHNDEYLVIALSELGQIGVDVEMSHLPYDEKLYGWILHKEEKVNYSKAVCFLKFGLEKKPF